MEPASCAVAMYISRQIYDERRRESEREGADGWWVVSNCSPRGVKGDPYIVLEKITILFFAHPLLRSTPAAAALSARAMPADSPTPLREIIDVKITGKRTSAFIVLRSSMVDWRPRATKGFFLSFFFKGCHERISRLLSLRDIISSDWLKLAKGVTHTSKGCNNFQC